ELVRLRVVRQQDVRPAVVVVIENSYSEALGSRIVEIRFLSGILEFPIPEIVPEPRRRTFVRFRSAVGFSCPVERTEKIALDRPLHVIRNHQIELAVAIVINPGCAGGKFVRSPETRRFRDIGECTVPVVMKQMTLAQPTDEEVVEAIVVVISDRNSQSEHRNCQACFAGYIREGTVVVVVIKLQSARRAGMPRPIFAVDQNDIGPTVVVIIYERTARPHSFRQIFLSKCAVVVSEMDASLQGDVAEMGLLGWSSGGQTHSC